MTTKTNVENSRQYESRFFLLVEQILASLQALTWLEKLRTCLQISKECVTMSYIIDNSYLDRYLDRYLERYLDRYRYNVQITCVQLLEFTFSCN